MQHRLSVRGNANYKICLDNVSWLVTSGKTAEDAAAPTPSAGAPLAGEPLPVEPLPDDPSALARKKIATADRLKDELARGVDDIKAFFYKGIAASAHSHANKQPSPGVTASPGPAWNSASGPTPRSALAWSQCHPRQAEAQSRLHGGRADPEVRRTRRARTSTMTTEEWTFKCRDGVVHVQFKQVGYSGSSSSSASEKLRLEVTSIDSSSSPVHAGPHN